MNNDPMPTATSLGEWSADKNARGKYEIRFELNDLTEWRAWRTWLLNHVTDDEGLQVFTVGG